MNYTFTELVKGAESTFQLLPELVEKEGEHTVFNMIDSFFMTMDSIRSNFDQKEEEAAKKIFQEKVLPLAGESKFCKHMIDKPYGYAGDFMAMEIIYDSFVNKESDKDAGTTRRGEIINNYSMQTSNCRANYHRVKFLLSKINEVTNDRNHSNITSVGCGPSLEIREFFEEEHKNRNVNFFLIDMEKEAIKFSKNKLSEFKTDTITYIRENVLKLALRNNAKEIIGEQDLIYSSGLYDYLAVKSAKKLSKALWQSIKPGGRLLITNAHPSNPTKFMMEYAGDWYLDYKTKDDMYRIVEDLDDVKKINYYFDDYSVYQYIEVHKSEMPVN